jgi:hypothetical protein
MNFILDTDKVRELAKPSHARCHGSGISGYTGGGAKAIVCRCVWRALEKKGVNAEDRKAMEKAIAGKAVLSINDHPDMRRVFDGFPTEAVGINYTVNNRSGANSSARELIIRNW